MLSIASVFLVIATFGMCYFGSRAKDHDKQFDTMQAIQVAIYFVSEVIMIGIINTIVTKILVLKDEESDESADRLSEVKDINRISFSPTGDSDEPVNIDPVGSIGRAF